MTDLQILLIAVCSVAVLFGYVALMRARGAMSALELLIALAAAFVFGYLVWALLRPEDF